MNRTRHYIRTLLLVLLLAGGGNEAWADKTVTYHVITLPFGSAELTGVDGGSNPYKYRIEALKTTVTCADDAVIELPSTFKSPLLTDGAYTYYYTGNGGVTINASQKIFPNNPLLFNTYTIDESKALAANATVAAIGAETDIYVTYDWAGHKSALSGFLKLDGSELYNIEFVYKDKSTEKHEFFAMNMNSERGNRAQAIPFEYIKAPSDLCTDGPHKLIDGKSDETKTDFHYTWLLVNDDPYNIFLETAYAKDKDDWDWGEFTYAENNYPKKSRRARFYGRVNSATAVETNSWMNNEWGYGWPSGNGGTPVSVPGWFRGSNLHGINTNGVQDRGLYFSFALLKRTAADNDFTLVALCSNTNATSWVPNNSGFYLHLGRKVGKYPGPYYSSFEEADRVILHDLKTYHFKIKTPFYNDAQGPTQGDNPNHVLSYDLLLSEHYDPYNVMDFIPEALKRKYVTFDGAYKTYQLDGVENNAITTFADADNANNDREVWLKYSTQMPFHTATASTTFDNLEWYNIYENKEDQYITWYDETHNLFNTRDNPSKYSHISHFAFVGDPYELYLVNRQASESHDNTFHYLTFDDTPTRPIVSSTTAGRWEIVYDNNTGDYADCFRLRKFNSYSDPETDPKYIGWMYGSITHSNYPLNGSTIAVRLSAVELPLMNYTYYIVDTSGHIAVMATAEQMVGTTLNYESIPEVIRSPFINGASLTFYRYNTVEGFNGFGTDVASNYNFSTDEGGKLQQISHTNSDKDNEFKNHIFVKYSNLNAAYTSLINGTQEYNVALYNQFIYHDEDNGTHTIKSVNSLEGSSASSSDYLWILGGSDPYAMTIKNKDYQYVEVPDLNNGAGGAPDGKPDWADGSLGWSSDAPASKFIIKAGNNSNTYEVMAATGTEMDASVTYYNIGRTDNVTVKLYSNANYPHGYEQIRFQLKKSSAKPVLYHLIDLSNNDLIQETGRQAIEEQPQIPAEIISPLVEKYTYWKTDPRSDDSDSNKYGENEKFEDYYKTPEFPEGYWENNQIHVYITYVTNDLVDMNHTTMYLLKYEQGELFRQEDGSDGLLDAVTPEQVAAMTEEEKKAYTNTYKAVYPYCNGDGNFFVYGQQQYDIQQEGAASTRTRWAWYIESGNHDPYHVKILSRQTETYDGLERSAYFSTRKFDGWNEVVTALVWPNISGVQATEYMVLGSVNQYQLVTTYPIDFNGDGDTIDPEDRRYVVDSFEQYWKTYDTVKKKLLADLLSSCPVQEQTDRVDGSIEVPTTPASLRERLTGTGEGQYGFHSYQKMAKAKRWNGYNAAGEKSKGWETREHWFQTVKMGSGYFNLIPTTIDPALILLDQHGWEIIRKPLPSGPDDPNKDKKYEVLRQYDSPMVKEYIFWATAKKRSGFHQYYALDKRIGGSDFSSPSLTQLPEWESENVKDNKGNLVDQYVTYIVKEEYAQSYDPATKTGSEFLIRQGDKLANNNSGGTTIGKIDLPAGGVSQYIIDNISSLSSVLWYVKPNANIDTEMGYTSSNHNWGDTNPNAYDSGSPYATNQAAVIITNSAHVTKYGRFSFSNGFDPYNLQISSHTDFRYFTLHMTNSKVSEGSMIGEYDAGQGGSKNVTLGSQSNPTVSNGTGYDNSKWFMTNQTFMAVTGDDGNMQLMPRFDHTHRMRNFATLVTPTAEAADPGKLKETYTELYRPYVYNYRIIDNEGHESLRYQSGGELVPQTPDHLKSPLAKDFKYYKNLTYNDATGIYTEVANGSNISSKEITASFAGAGLTTNSNIVYVRYNYDKDADALHVLLGKWLTMKLNNMDAQYSAGIKTGTKPATSPNDDLKAAPAWHWKFLKNPYTAPDPYAVQLFNRSEKDKQMRTPTLDGGTVGTTGEGSQYFALLNHEDGGYALTVARTEDHTKYYFLNGGSMSESTAAITAKETDFTSTSGSFTGTNSQILLTDEINNTFTYHIYTHGTNGSNEVKYGIEAVSDTQTQYDAEDNGFAPKLPETIKTPLLNFDQFIYYESVGDMGNSSKELTNLYGLYEGDVYVRYQPYDPSVSEYKVPNDRNEPGDGSDHKDPVAKGDKSNDAPLRLDNVLPHNIIWYDDNMMKANGTSIDRTADQPLQHSAAYEWTFEGDDPYAIKIRHKGTTTEPYKYVHTTTCSDCSGTGKNPGETTCATCGGTGLSSTSCDLSASATPFMLLNRDGYEYGVFAITGNKDVMLSGYGNELVVDDHNPETTTDNPTKFIIFSLGTLKVIYHLVIANIDSQEEIPYRHRTAEDNYSTAADYRWNEDDGYYTAAWASTDKMSIDGTTKRDLTTAVNGVAGDKYQLGETISSFPLLDGTTGAKTYCKDVGPISLGDALTEPAEFSRPNVNYFFVVHDIRNDNNTENSELNQKYKGLQITSKEMSMNEDLIGKIIYINIVYKFNTDIEANSGDNFVLGLNENKWYTLETVINNKPYLAQYTNAWGFELKEGRGSHYTNDFLWSPIGDPYGFQLFNRYMDVNSGDDNLGEKDRVIFSRHFLNNKATDEFGGDNDIHTGGQQILMGNYKEDQKLVVVGKPGGPIVPYPHGTVAENSIYELLESSTIGYFRFHPVANTIDQTQVYFNHAEADDDGDTKKNLLVRLSPSAAEFTFNLTPELLKPYFDRAGYVGGLKKNIYDAPANAALKTAMKADEPVLTAQQLMAAQKLVYNMENIVPFATGYYRLHSPLGISGIDPARYVSGYTHAIERDLDGNDDESDAIPMHFFEKNSNEVRQFTDFKEGGFTYSNATRGDITIPSVEKDPASIFYFEKISRAVDYPSSVTTNEDKARYNLTYVSTQGLYVRGTVAKGTAEVIGDRAKAVMTNHALSADMQHPDADKPTPLFVMDLGGGVLLIHDNHTANGRSVLKYLSYDYSNDTEGNSTIYDMKLTNHTHTDHAKFCMQPVQDTETQGINEMGLKLDLKQDKANGYYYASFYAPFDVLLTDAENDLAYICKEWDTEIIHLKKIGKYNAGVYKDNNQFVPAGTPVIIRSNKASATLALPTKTPSESIDEGTNIFRGEYLEQLLPKIGAGALDVYTFGYPMTAKSVETNASTGVITFDQQHKGESDMGFYINATPNREGHADMGSWIRNNWYVYGNKIYYRESVSPSRQDTRGVEFIPVVFDDDDDDEPIDVEDVRQQAYDNRVYDLQGRQVATPQEVEDGTWRSKLSHGIYILNGKKIRR